MWRACLRTFGRCRQAGDTANHSGIEDQVIEDQQASLQRDRRLSKALPISSFSPLQGSARHRQLTSSSIGDYRHSQCVYFQHLAVAAGLHSHTPGNAMLRIQRTANGDVVFTLSGRIDKQHIPELEALIVAEGNDRRIVLDLKDMTLTGQDGIAFLAQCEVAGIALVNCDPYVREWITGQGTGK